MKVLWFTTTPSLGAEYFGIKNVGCSWIQSLEGELTKIDNVQLGIAFIWYGDNLKPAVVNGTSYYPIKINEVKGKIKNVQARWSHRIILDENLQKYLDIIEDFAPDVIHLFGTESDYGLLISKIKIPCIIHIQGSLTAVHNKWYSGLTSKEVFKNSKKWPLLKGNGLFHEYFYNKKMAEREREIYQACKYFVGRTDWDRRISSVLSPKASYFHCDEIMRNTFYLHQWQQHKDRKEYVIISTLRKNIYKGFETIYECKEMLQQSFPEYNFIWKIAGTSDRDEVIRILEKKYKNKFKNLGIDLLGSVDENNLVNEMLSADLYVHPSHIENSSNSICEAMLMGMPVIATYAGGTSNMLEDKKEGILIQDGDPYSLAGAIIELKKNKEYANALGKSARARTVVRHNPDTIVKTVMNIYTSVIQMN